MGDEIIHFKDVDWNLPTRGSEGRDESLSPKGGPEVQPGDVPPWAGEADRVVAAEKGGGLKGRDVRAFRRGIVRVKRMVGVSGKECA